MGSRVPANVTLAEADDGRSVMLAKGGTLEVSLPAQLGTGFGWQPPKTSLLALSKTTTERASDGKPGGFEKQVFAFSAMRPGKETLIFEYRRPWEKDAPAARRFTVELTIAAD